MYFDLGREGSGYCEMNYTYISIYLFGFLSICMMTWMAIEVWNVILDW